MIFIQKNFKTEPVNLMDQSLSEIACDSDKNYHQFARIKRKALEKLRCLM
ncbi:hypothetical protein [Clostridium bowmanii]|nr:hypothetical protein [Clostridium bowmanii]MBU3191340.1 hypothetical protein [Clostridium bowmanii]